MSDDDAFAVACPAPLRDYPQVLLAHGGGGRLMHHLLAQLVLPAFDGPANPALAERHDGARLALGGARLAFTTDGYVVHPLIFPGGDIGSLAVNGTINDLAMCGARPLALSASLILEEGLPMATLARVLASMRQAADAAGVAIVTGDTKVVDRGKGDGLYISTAGIGIIEHEQVIAPASVRPGDVVLLSGDIGRHGIAIMAVREGLAFETTIESDCAPLAAPVAALLAAGVPVHCLRDLTRGGLASALVEIAETAGVQIDVDEAAIPVAEEVQGACEILGLDPLYVANEGRFIAIVPAAAAAAALAVLQVHSLGGEARVIGQVTDATPGLVTMRSLIGVARVVDLHSGEQLPRIC
ncbi:MAG: hydrogenase expression/formation protein HypE [Chloroflexi bacterium]|nr:hydrogenase expression/formation protein HypE [Chloroflexota bacterium]